MRDSSKARCRGESYGDVQVAAPPCTFLTFSSSALQSLSEQTAIGPNAHSFPGPWSQEALSPPPGLETPEHGPTAPKLRFDTGSFGHPHFCNRPCVHIAKGHVCPKGMACAYCHFPHRPIPKPDWQLRQSLLAASDQELLVTFLPIISKKAEKEGLLPRVDSLIELLKAEVRGAQCEPIPMGSFRPMRMSFVHPGMSWPFVSEAAQFCGVFRSSEAKVICSLVSSIPSALLTLRDTP